MQQQHPDKQVEVWAEDEGRMGLKPITRRHWAVRGQRPIAVQQRSYQWLHTYVFVQLSLCSHVRAGVAFG